MIPPPIFFAIKAAAIIKPSVLPSAFESMLPDKDQPTIQAIIVDIDATTKLNNNGPHLDMQSRKSAPSRMRGVASCNDNSCNDFDATVPPGDNIPIDANRNVIAIAVTGPPNSLPIFVLVPNCCAIAALPVNVARFPQVSVELIKDVDAIDNLEYDEFGRCCCCGLASSNLGRILWLALVEMIDAEVVTWFTCFVVKQWTVTMALDRKISPMILRIFFIFDGCRGLYRLRQRRPCLNGRCIGQSQWPSGQTCCLSML